MFKESLGRCSRGGVSEGVKEGVRSGVGLSGRSSVLERAPGGGSNGGWSFEEGDSVAERRAFADEESGMGSEEGERV